MVPLTGFREELEKSATKTGDIIFKGLGSTLKFMGKHPKATVGVIGGGALALATANKIHDLYEIVNEERKRRIMKGQTGVLKSILAEQVKGNKLRTPPPPPPYKRKVAPLS